MAIDSIRLLTDSTAQLWRKLNTVHPLEQITDPFDEWLGPSAQHLDPAEQQALRREYKCLATMIDELATLVRSRPRALELVRAELAAHNM